MKDKSVAAPHPLGDVYTESEESSDFLDNIFAELYHFTRTLLASSAEQKPQTSPEKPEEIVPKYRTSQFFKSAYQRRLFVDRTEELDSTLGDTQIFMPGRPKPLPGFELNAFCLLYDIESGRFYKRLTDKVSLFIEMLSTKSHDNCKKLFLRWGVHPSFLEKFLLVNCMYLKVVPMRLIMFISITNSYPTVDNQTIWERLEQNGKSENSYLEFKKLEFELFKSKPTRINLELAQTPENLAFQEPSPPSTPKSAAVTRRLGDLRLADSDSDSEREDEEANSLQP